MEEKNYIFTAVLARNNLGFLFEWDEINFKNILFILRIINESGIDGI